MTSFEDPFETVPPEVETEPTADNLAHQAQVSLPPAAASGAATARFHRLDLADRAARQRARLAG